MTLPRDEYQKMHGLVTELEHARRLGRPTAPITSRINALRKQYEDDPDLARIEDYIKKIPRFSPAERKTVVESVCTALKIAKPRWIEDLEYTELIVQSEQRVAEIAQAVKEHFKIDYRPRINQYLAIADLADLVISAGLEA